MIPKAPRISTLTCQNVARAKAQWPGECSKSTLHALRELTTRFGFSVRMGEIRLLNGAWVCDKQRIDPFGQSSSLQRNKQPTNPGVFGSCGMSLGF
jgi:hypothetical protein